MKMKQLFRFGDQRGTYWSHSKLAEWIRKTFAEYETPVALGMSEWDEWKKDKKARAPFVYWLTNKAFSFVQNLIYYPADVWDRIRYYIVNRYFDKTHMMQTKLTPGDWHEFDTRLLHGVFEELVDFIEVEKAHMYMWTSEHREELPFFYRHKWLRPIRFKRFRSAEFGLKYLEWEMSLAEPQIDEWGNDHSMPSQAHAAKEQFELYNWWKNVRPARKDPYEASGWTALCEQRREKGNLFLAEPKDDSEREQTSKALDDLNKIEQAYEQEDEDMLIRLIKIRGHLWT